MTVIHPNSPTLLYPVAPDLAADLQTEEETIPKTAGRAAARPVRGGRHLAKDNLLLALTRRYRALPLRVAERFIGEPCGQAARALSLPSEVYPAPPLKRHTKMLGSGPHRDSYVQLTAAGCRLLGLSQKRSEPFGTAALTQHVAISFFCAVGRHVRLTPDEAATYLGQAARANVPHVLANVDGHFALLRVYHAVSPPSVCVKHLLLLAADLRANSHVGRNVKEREYGLAVLAPSPKELTALRKAIDRASLQDDVLMVTGLGPTPATLVDALKKTS